MPDKSVSYAFVQALYDSVGAHSTALEPLAGDADALKASIGNTPVAPTPVPIVQTLSVVPAFPALSPHPLPCWQQNGVCTPRNSAWHINNTAAYTIKAGTAFVTGASLKANTSYSVVIMHGDGTISENTLAVNSTGTSLSFTAEQAIKAASFVVFISEEALD